MGGLALSSVVRILDAYRVCNRHPTMPPRPWICCAPDAPAATRYVKPMICESSLGTIYKPDTKERTWCETNAIERISGEVWNSESWGNVMTFLAFLDPKTDCHHTSRSAGATSEAFDREPTRGLRPCVRPLPKKLYWRKGTTSAVNKRDTQARTRICAEGVRVTKESWSGKIVRELCSWRRCDEIWFAVLCRRS